MNQLGPILFLIAAFLFSTFLNWYVFQAVRTICENLENVRLRQGIHLAYWLIFTGLTIWLIFTFITIFSAGEISKNTQYVLNIFLTVLVTQLVIVLVLFSEDIYRNALAGFGFIFNGKKDFTFPNRHHWISITALVLGAVPFFSFIYGIAFGKYNYTVHREVVYFESLPDAFEGFTIVQISDIHSGSFKPSSPIYKGVDLTIAQAADLFVFTGDLVNHKAEEIEPFIAEFARIRAPYGQFSILGNHDYGDYVSWPSRVAKAANFERLIRQHDKLGYRLLLDEHVTIEKEGDQIFLLGVENWGVGFKSKGDLEKALDGLKPEDFKILLSHDPSHWDEEVKKHTNTIHLTLSGHTHGMQMGIETPFFRWSPVQYRYPNWAGLANYKDRVLYVNRGFGFHAFSGRVGIWPEVTVIELRKKKG